MKTLQWQSVVLLAVLCVSIADAAAINTVPVGNPGNAGDLPSNGTFGAVGYSYRIGRTEVTNAQYAEFLNSVDPAGVNTLALYNSKMSSDALGGIIMNSAASSGSKYEIKSGRANNPVVFVSWYDSIRFANWLHNGQGSGDTETGAYTLGALLPFGTPLNGVSITRNEVAKWWVPNENEWYKAAYHKNDGVTGNYWDYPTATDDVPFSDEPPGITAPTPYNTGNFRRTDAVANGYDDGYAVTGSNTFASSQNYLTDVGAYATSASPYGTFDQGGNVFEWTENLTIDSVFQFRHYRGLRGGSWDGHFLNLRATGQSISIPVEESIHIGFRVATIPEPSTGVLGPMACAGMCLFVLRKGI